MFWNRSSKEISEYLDEANEKDIEQYEIFQQLLLQ
jgi:hypothetical protein